MKLKRAKTAPIKHFTAFCYIACCMQVFIVQSQLVTSLYKSNILSYQSALTLIRSTNLFCFLWVGKPQTALKGGTWAGICYLLGKFWFQRGSCDLPMW